MEIGDSGRYIVAVVRENGEDVSGPEPALAVVFDFSFLLLEVFSSSCLRFFEGEAFLSCFLYLRFRSASVVVVVDVFATGELSKSIASTAMVNAIAIGVGSKYTDCVGLFKAQLQKLFFY